LTEEEKEAICEACDMAVELNNCKLKIFEYVESRMAFIAPNLSIIVGASTAAKIMGIFYIKLYYIYKTHTCIYVYICKKMNL
jgi:hypothetical protein